MQDLVEFRVVKNQCTLIIRVQCFSRRAQCERTRRVQQAHCTRRTSRKLIEKCSIFAGSGAIDSWRKRRLIMRVSRSAGLRAGNTPVPGGGTKKARAHCKKRNQRTRRMCAASERRSWQASERSSRTRTALACHIPSMAGRRLTRGIEPVVCNPKTSVARSSSLEKREEVARFPRARRRWHDDKTGERDATWRRSEIKRANCTVSWTRGR